jgi:O-antigen ligase
MESCAAYGVLCRFRNLCIITLDYQEQKSASSKTSYHPMKLKGWHRMNEGMRQEATFTEELITRRGAQMRVAAILSRFIFYALLAIVAFAAIPYGTVQPWWQAFFNCAIFILAALWLIEGFLKNSWDFNAYRLLWPLVALAVFAFLQTLPLLGAAGEERLEVYGAAWRAVSADPHGTREWCLKMMALVLVCAMLLRYATNLRRLRALIFLVLGVALASAVFGLLRQMMQHQTGFVLPYLKEGFGYGQFVNKNHFAFLMEMAFGLVLGLILWGGLHRERRLACAGLALLLGGVLVLSNSRGGVFALFCQLLFAALLFSGARPSQNSSTEQQQQGQLLRGAQRFTNSLALRVLLLSCLAVIIITTGIIWVGGDPLAGSLEAMPKEVGAPVEGIRWAVRRWDIWPDTWLMIKDHPAAGVGFGGYWMAITFYHNGSGEMTPQEAHNDYLEFLASGGLIGLTLGLWFIHEFIGSVRRRLRAPDQFGRAAACGALIGISGIAVHSFVDFGLHVTINADVLMLLFVIATARLSPPQSQRGKP